jgi:hypothetical protein
VSVPSTSLLACSALVTNWVDDSPSALAVALASTEMEMDNEPSSSRTKDTCSWLGTLSLVLETLSTATANLPLLLKVDINSFPLWPYAYHGMGCKPVTVGLKMTLDWNMCADLFVGGINLLFA